MTKANSTKKALLSSAFAILICVAMLIGTTFAWFTDTAKAAVNRIQSGTLDVALEMKNSEGDWVSAEGETLNFVKAPGAEAEEILWEPGVTYALPELRIVNKGNLALKYKIAIAGAKDATPENDKNDLMLLDVIDWTYEVGGTSYALESEKHLAAKKGDEESFDTFTVKGHMQETANNDYQGLSIDSIAITVVATQDTVESDSYNNQYDKNADYPEVQPVATLEKLEEVLNSDDINGKTVKLYDDITADALPVNGKDVAIDLNGKSLNTKKLEVKNSTVVIKDSSESKEGTITTDDSYGTINAANSDITIESGRFVSTYNKVGSSGYASVIQACNSNLTINGGYFENTDAVGSYNYLIKIPCYSRTEKSTVTVNGGEFVSHRDYGYIITSDSDANVDVVINGGIFKTAGRNSYLTQVKGNVLVNDCTFTATGNNTVFDIPKDSTVTVKGGTYSANENSYTDTSLAGLIFHRKTNGWTSVSGTLLVDPVNPVKVNQPTYSGFLAAGAKQSAKGADGFYTITK